MDGFSLLKIPFLVPYYLYQNVTVFLFCGKDGPGHDFQRGLRNQLLYFLCLTSERIEALKCEVTCLMVPSGWWQNWIRRQISWTSLQFQFVRDWPTEEVILELFQARKSESCQCRTSLVLGKGSLGF